jgi:hypothetical protein
MKNIFALVFLILFGFSSFAQLKPGFMVDEYLEMLSVSRGHIDSLIPGDKTPASTRFKKLYRSKEIGLLNRWELWEDATTAVISIRGTTADLPSWMENFYAAMVPATGSIKLENNFTFNYQLAKSEEAKVHVGWLLGLAYLQRDILPKLDSLDKAGKHQIFIMGHSQGAALSYLLRSHLHYLQQQGKLNKAFKFKTFCSAPPKPGNLYYAYDFEAINYGGWAFSIINSADWVPETPFSIQTLRDINPTNPFINLDKALKTQPLLVRLYAKRLFNRIDKSTSKAQQRFEHYMGTQVFKILKKTFPEMEEPQYESSNAYTRVGTPIILTPDEQYLKERPLKDAKVFSHHTYWAYYQLALNLK